MNLPPGLKLKGKYETYNTWAHTQVYLNGNYIGYIIKTTPDTNPRVKQFHFVPRPHAKLPALAGTLRKEVIQQLIHIIEVTHYDGSSY